jgi:translation initiation factor 3 subunit F
MDLEYNRTMTLLHTRLNESEVVVGWYATGSQLIDHSSIIHEFYAKETLPIPALHLLLDTDTSLDSPNPLNLQIFYGASVGAGESSTVGYVFLPLRHELLCYSEEEAACMYISLIFYILTVGKKLLPVYLFPPSLFPHT